MRTALAVLLVAPLFSGCLGGGSSPNPTDGGDGDGGGSGPPTTVDALLNRSKHIKVYAEMTIKWDFANLSSPGYTSFASLLYFAREQPLSILTFRGEPLLVAFVPLTAPAKVTSCGTPPVGVKDHFWPRDAGNRGNLTGALGPGWYHAVMVANQVGSFAATFNATAEQPVLTPHANVYVNGSAATSTEGRAPQVSGSGLSGTWFAWATHVIDPGPRDVADGGREQVVSIEGSCRSRSQNTGGDTDDLVLATPQRLSVDAAGRGASLRASGSYTPLLENPDAPQATRLDAAWIWIQDVTLPAPAPA